MKTEEETATRIRSAFKRLKSSYPLIFESSDDDEIRFDNHTIHDVVYELASIKLVDVTPETISEAFQVFRAANLKSGEGQYFTPSRVIRSAVALMEVGYDDRIIDPACGTGGFLVESYLALARENPDLSETDLQHWAQTHVYGVDRDDINVKLARAIMQIIGDGSSNIEIGDSLRQHMWKQDYPHLKKTLADESYTCVITNPPFGRALRMSAKDARLSRYTITRKSTDRHHDLEVGLVFLERCYRLLSDRGRLGIILPETYWFSSTYTWLREWLESRFVLRGMFNVPMEAFQSFCRAKTNFYVLEKIADKAKSDNTAEIAPPRPSWFRENKVVVSSAPTCGINKDGIERVLVDPEQEAEGDILYADVKAIRRRRSTATTRIVPIDRVIEPWRAVPTHFDTGPLRAFESARQSLWPGWSEVAIDELIGRKWMIRRDGHGSPPKDQRSGVIPYIKVSDLRAGLVNINPTNMVSQELAEQLWNSESSGLQAFDLLSPERASSNIGEFCVLMPGQEQLVITREVLIFRVTNSAPFDAFFLLWALSLRVVREQWRRVTFMQTNREDVGDRYREILLPIPIGEDGAFDEEQARVASRDFREYFVGLSKLRTQFARSLSAFDVYHFKLSVPSETDSVSQV